MPHFWCTFPDLILVVEHAPVIVPDSSDSEGDAQVEENEGGEEDEENEQVIENGAKQTERIPSMFCNPQQSTQMLVHDRFQTNESGDQPPVWMIPKLPPFSLEFKPARPMIVDVRQRRQHVPAHR